MKKTGQRSNRYNEFVEQHGCFGDEFREF
nr:type II toxin-antitoxin system CcdA family antitoxin [Chromohalobacter canadensis]